MRDPAGRSYCWYQSNRGAAGFRPLPHGVLALQTRCWPAARACGIHRHDGPRRPVKQHPYARQPDLDGGHSDSPLQFLDVSGDMDGLDVAQVLDAVPAAPFGDLAAAFA